jgi:molybdenum cofactor biosynthesis protein B
MAVAEKAIRRLTAHCVILCISDSISVDHDSNGKVIESLLHEKGHELVYRRIIKNRQEAIKEAIGDALADENCDFIVTTGGTGLTRKDVTVRVLSALYDEELPGFGELFRNLSYQEIGSAALITRAAAGIIEGHPVFSLPGSPSAVRMGMEMLILPEISRILAELRH